MYEESKIESFMGGGDWCGRRPEVNPSVLTTDPLPEHAW